MKRKPLYAKILSFSLILVLISSMTLTLTPSVTATSHRPSLPDGPAHTEELVNIIAAANTTKVLIVTEGWGPFPTLSFNGCR